RWQCYRALGQLFTFHLSIRKDHRLVTEGPYSTVRHPSYTAGLMTLLGALLAHGSSGSWLRESGLLEIPGVGVTLGCLAAVFYWSCLRAAARIPEEDKMMRLTFKGEWEGYAKRVKYRLVPFVY
ncbi:hypothetical protein HYDPIDRAFT_95911, partial [Hydnomerulius pinastri MD-312]